jgi:serine/threonine kinase 16
LLNATPTISVNSTSFKLLNILGEGSYSIVYLVEPNSFRKKFNKLYALKKIKTISTLSTQKALNEVSYYKQFNSPYLIKSIDSSSVQEIDGSNSIYILLPYYENGTLKDLINLKNLNPNDDIDNILSIKKILEIFILICKGVLTLHLYHKPQANFLNNNNNRYSDLIDDINSSEMSESVPYAHYDLKPENIFLSKDENNNNNNIIIPKIGDLGSVLPARIEITSRTQAITFQELVAENSTPEYRAPELYNIKINDSFDERVDVWSLGCILYTMFYGVNPFTREVETRGGNLKLAITGGHWSFPDQYLQQQHHQQEEDEIRGLIKSMLVVDCATRITLPEVLRHSQTLLETLS